MDELIPKEISDQNFKAIDLYISKLHLEPGDVILIKMDKAEMTKGFMEHLKEGMDLLFPANGKLYMAKDDTDIAIVKFEDIEWESQNG